MRTGSWVLAFGGITGVALSVGLAQDSLFDGARRTGEPAPATQKVQSYFSRSGQAGEQETKAAPAAAPIPSALDIRPGGTRYQRTRPAGEGATTSAAAPSAAPTATTDRAADSAALRNYHEQLFGTPRPQAAVSKNASPSPAARPATASKALPLPDDAEHAAGGVRAADHVLPARGIEMPSAPPAPLVINADHRRAAGAAGRGDVVQTAGTATDPAGRLAVAELPEESGPQTPSVTLEWHVHDEVSVGRESSCDLTVKNTGRCTASDVVVEAHFPRSVRLVGADPKPVESRTHLAWHFAKLSAGDSRSVRLKFVPSQTGDLGLAAHVRFTGSSTNVLTVKEPLLHVTVEGPGRVTAGEPAVHVVTVTNPGSGTAHDVSVEALIPSGLEHPKGEKLAMAVGSLGPGESRQVRLALAAIRGGRHVLQVEATAAPNLRQSASAAVDVIAPSLKVALDGPGLRYLGRHAEYVLSVANDGSAPTSNVRAVHKVPEGFDFVKADKGGQFDPATRTVTWFVGRMESGQNVQVRVQLNPTTVGTFQHRAGALSEHGARAETAYETRVDGTASLVLEIVDLDDPVEVGAETAYEIRVSNEGTKAAQDVSIGCELPLGVQLLNAKGPAEHVADGSLLVFKPIPSLEPGKTALYRVHVKGTVEGQQRFRVRLASDSTKEPLVFEELTKFYID